MSFADNNSKPCEFEGRMDVIYSSNGRNLLEIDSAKKPMTTVVTSGGVGAVKLVEVMCV